MTPGTDSTHPSIHPAAGDWPAAERPVLHPDLVAELRRGVHAASGDEDVARLFAACLTRTLDYAVTPLPDGSAAVVTGDIPAMWLRDSSAQLSPYLTLVQAAPGVADLIAAVLRRQLWCIAHDPYANAFNLAPDGGRYEPDDRCTDPWIWEQKYEVDSLAHPVVLAWRWWRATGRTEVFDRTAHRALALVVEVMTTEQDHEARSAYRFERPNGPPSETLAGGGLGTPVALTGMTWSGFRPSDDACRYGYNVPGNLFAATALDCLAELAAAVFADPDLARRACATSQAIRVGVAAHGVVEHPRFGAVYAYEVDGLGGRLLMDDANLPSLLSLPQLGSCAADDPVWTATRAFVLSPENPHYVEGAVAAGVGSPHTEPGYVWPLALMSDALTSGSARRRGEVLAQLASTHDGTWHIHESFHVDDPARWTRSWFSWGDATYVELALAHAGPKIGLTPAPAPSGTGRG